MGKLQYILGFKVKNISLDTSLDAGDKTAANCKTYLHVGVTFYFELGCTVYLSATLLSILRPEFMQLYYSSCSAKDK